MSAERKERKNILICGGSGYFCRQVIRRLAKEKQNVYLLTGSEKREGQEKTAAFQEYHFSFHNESLVRIIQNVSPDQILILGAYDSLYDWARNDYEVTRFLSGVTNILDAARKAGTPEVTFLSSDMVSEYEEEGRRIFEIRSTPYNEMLKVMARAEMLLQTYSDERMRASVLRLPLIYGGYEPTDGLNVCQRLAESFIWNQEMTYTPAMPHSAVFYKDAAEAVLRFLQEEGKSGRYQARGLLFTEKELADTILSQNPDVRDTVKLRKMEMDSAAPAIPDEIENEFPIEMKYSLQEGVRQLLAACRKAREEGRKKKDGSFWKRQLLPLAENIALFCVAFWLTRWLQGTWIGENLDLFLLYTLFIGVTWGTAHALLASLFSGAAELWFYLGMSDRFFVRMDNGFFVSFLQILVVGVTAGFMRDKFRRRNQDLNDERDYYYQETQDLLRIHDNNVYVKNLFEKRLTGYRNSLARVQEITSRMDFMESHKVLFQAVKVVAEVMETEHAAIYMAGQDGRFFRLAAASSEKARQMGKSIRYDEDSFLYRRLSSREIYQNRRMEEKRPTFAGAVYQDDVPKVIVMVWMDHIDRVNLYNSNLMAVLCRMLEGAVRRAALYEESVYRDAYLPGSRIMKEENFRQVEETFEEGRRQNVLQYTRFKVLLNGQPAQEAEKLVRDTDILGTVGPELYLLLLGSAKEDSRIVQERFADKKMALAEMGSEVAGNE